MAGFQKCFHIRGYSALWATLFTEATLRSLLPRKIINDCLAILYTRALLNTTVQDDKSKPTSILQFKNACVVKRSEWGRTKVANARDLKNPIFEEIEKSYMLYQCQLNKDVQ